MSSNDVNNFNRLGIQYYKDGNYKEAIVNFNSAIELAPYNPDYFHNRAECYRLSEQYEKAIEDYNVVLKSSSGDATDYYKRGICYSRTDSHQQAIDDFNNAIKLKPTIDDDCYMCRALAFCMINDRSGAIMDLEFVLSRNPNHTVASQMLAALADRK